MENARVTYCPSSTEFPIHPIRYRMHEEYLADDLDELKQEDHVMWKTERIEFKSVGY